jgi:hypothetical protein
MSTPLNSVVSPSPDYGLWVGFNDLNPFQPNSTVLLCTGSANWRKPPRLGEVADVVAFDAEKQQGTVIGHTRAVNYPIGARPQTATSNGLPVYILNNIYNNIAAIDIYNHQFCLIKTVYGFHHWCTSSDGSYSFCLDLEATHRLGGYGYVFGNQATGSSVYSYPNRISLYSHYNDTSIELISIEEAALLVSRHLGINYDMILVNSYFSHLLLSPNEDCLAFLFRTWLRDGGILTVLMSIDFETGYSIKSINIELAGQLSHFTWTSNNEILIYCYQILSKRSTRLRLQNLSHILPLSKIAKVSFNVFKVLAPKKSKSSNFDGRNDVFPFVSVQKLPCFMTIRDRLVKPSGLNLPIGDGHPSVIRSTSEPTFISDTYPNINMKRCLFAFSLVSGNLILKDFHLEYRPATLPTYPWVSRHIRLPHYAVFPVADQSFTRSGLHCDLHPFSNADGSILAYHTSESGYRTVEVTFL